MPDEIEYSFFNRPRPAPSDVDVAYWQRRLDSVAGREGHLSRLRIAWAGTLMQTIYGKEILQYPERTYDYDAKVLRIPQFTEAGEPILEQDRNLFDEPEWNDDGTPKMRQKIEQLGVPYDEREWTEEWTEIAKTSVIGVREYIVIDPVERWVVQKLLPAAKVARTWDAEAVGDLSMGAYWLEHVCCVPDGSDWGRYRPPTEGDVEMLRIRLKKQAEALSYNPDEETPSWHKRLEARTTIKERKERTRDRDRAIAEARREEREKIERRIEYSIPTKG